MKQAFGVSIPERLGEICAPERCALIVYDMQAAIVPQIKDGKQIMASCAALLEAARSGGLRVFFTRHLFLPNRSSGAGQLRRAMIWQRKTDPAETRPLITQGSAGWQIVSELAPREDEVVIDKITMSAFESTFLHAALRDAQLQSFIIAGIALEVGIEPTVRHGADLNLIPVVAADACGSKTKRDHERSIATLEETGEVVISTNAEIVSCLMAR
jgi:nicotinamidase-related amidase